MPELPDIEAYVHALRPRILERRITRIRVYSPFVLRSFEPEIGCAEGKLVVGLRRIGKRIVLALEGELFLVIHLMIAGRLRWYGPEGSSSGPGRKLSLCSIGFENGTLWLTEAASKKRASLTLVEGEEALASLDPGGLEVLTCSPEAFSSALLKSNRTLKRALTDPRTFSGIGNAYSDEILHAARLSPVRLTRALTGEEIERLFEACRRVLELWSGRLRAQFHEKFPGAGEITAFREGFAVHGRAGLPCPDCGAPVQRIRYAENETNYCARCQNEGRLLADRALSRLLKDDWPKTLEQMLGE